ncbi:MAG TPA: hypothetical protein VNH39_10520 [Steroidobacteraceae bacterium]|nr:hypothetical protein [Steroidobacteraceae bacterium]
MIVKTETGWSALHIPTAARLPWPYTGGKKFDTYLGAKCWMLVMDDRYDTRGWPICVEVRTGDADYD